MIYNSDNFLEKNKDPLSDDIKELMAASTDKFITDELLPADMMGDKDAGSKPGGKCCIFKNHLTNVE